MSIEKLNSDSINFHTCKFRSDQEQEQLIKRCACQGGNYTIKGYWCEKKQIFDVKQEFCASCAEYEHK